MGPHRHAVAAVLLSVVLPAASMMTSASSASLQRDMAVSMKERPVMKVVRMLQDMRVELQKELDDDKAVHKQLSCWCQENDQEKTTAIEVGQARAEDLKSTMDETAAKIVELKQKRKVTMEEIEADTKSLGEATELRMKENQEFHSSETDLLDAIDAAKNAILVLSRHHPELAQVQSVAHKLLDAKVAEMVLKSSVLGKDKVDVLRAFLRGATSPSAFLAIPGYSSYAPQSGQIFGILKQMKEDFESNLSEEQKAEMKAREEYEALKAAKEQEIATGKQTVVQIDAELAKFGEEYAQAAQELEDTQAQLELDQEFLANLRKKCSETEAEFETRVKDRLTEIAAIEDTIHILNNDQAFESFDKMVAPNPPTLLQISEVAGQREQLLRQRAAAVLQRAATRSGNPQLALLAATAGLDAFTKVKEAIDKMVEELKKQQSDEVAHRDYCLKELAENNRSTEAAYDKKASLETQIADLNKKIEHLTKEIEVAKKSIADMNEQMKKASDTREAENADFQVTMADHRVMAAILAKALDRMKMVYSMAQRSATGQEPEEEQPGAAHIETSGNHTDPGNGPARFTEYEKNAGGARVVALLEKILADVQETVNQALTGEIDSQSAYEDLMKDLNKSILKTIQSIADMSGAMASAKESLTMAESDHKQTMTELEGLAETAASLHENCDFLLKNFDARQEARAAEIDALGEAKAILSGMQ